ncbi:hypothetical protein [Streptomyces sp. NBC_01451]|uniref:hypothetical protein n=1 Tax=Streptomyces sp. NBC_01451 TaxID=2903872 RepID=UPI002E32F0BD|nr:hypothetical protein [Streptomyces sp. NBC_01451]
MAHVANQTATAGRHANQLHLERCTQAAREPDPVTNSDFRVRVTGFKSLRRCTAARGQGLALQTRTLRDLGG